MVMVLTVRQPFLTVPASSPWDGRHCGEYCFNTVRRAKSKRVVCNSVDQLLVRTYILELNWLAIVSRTIIGGSNNRDLPSHGLPCVAVEIMIIHHSITVAL